ncbi:MAG: L-seryl-tRNA(Sec) selenium transferase [Gemmataceae bacterium]|nr:L-seryl-tRNA(Sec) selenium transferase [Gemmataceae bacterium]
MADADLRRLPAVHLLLADAALASAITRIGQPAVAEVVRGVLDDARTALRAGTPFDLATIVPQCLARLAARHRLRTVINATGVLIHTNLGRAPLADEAVRAVTEAARGYVNLELDLTTGKRSHRNDAVKDDICALLGAESAVVVNNCAAATVLTLRALAAGREVIVARGELVEIGGGFRIPDIMAASGATLREVGTTNITRIADYEKAIGAQSALLLRVHQSNFRIRGFTASPALADLIALGRREGLPVIDDIGSGALVDYSQWGMTDEPLAAASLAAGADVVLFSADKLLGGPQAGIIAGKKSLIDRIARDPFYRATRPCKLTLAALAATLTLYRRGDWRQISVLQLLDQSMDDLRQRAQELASAVGGVARDDTTFVGGGSCPDESIPTVVVTIPGPAEELAARLRNGDPPVMARIHNGELLLDLRSVLPHEWDELKKAVNAMQEPRTK